MAAQRRSSNSEENGVLALLPLACFAVGIFGGAPGIGLYIGLCFATKIFKSKPKADGSPGPTDLLKPLAWHPFASTVGPGSVDSWFPTARLSFWWNALGSSLLASSPLLIKGVIPEPKLLTLPLFLVLSFLGYLFALQMIVASKRKDKPPVMIEKVVLREMTPHLASAAIVGISFGILAILGLSHANLISASLVSHRSHISNGPNTYAGLGLSGAIACSVAVAFIFTFATASVAYKKQWLEPHLAHEQILVGWDGAWQRVLGSRLAPPIFISEAKDPEANPEVCAALFQVQAAVTVDDYAKEADKLASALGVETALIVPDFGRDETGKPMPGVHSTSVFKVTYPLVPIVMNAHLSHDPISKSLYDFIVASTFRRIFADLKLGQPNLWAISILTTPESPGRIVETLWMLSPGITFDQVAKATNSLAEKSGARWLRVGRRSNLLPDGVLVPMSFISVIFGDPPAMAEFANGKALKAEEHQRFVDEIEWDARFRSVGISSGGVGPNLIKSEEVRGQLRELADTDVTLRLWTFTYPPGLSPKDVESAMPALKSSGLPYVSFRTTQNPSNFQLLTADSDPLSLTYPFTKAAPKILFEPVLGTPRLKWTVGVGPDGEFVTFEFGTDDPHLLIAGMTGSGKDQPLNTLVAVPFSQDCPTGWTTIGDLKIGDKLFGADGSEISLTGLSPIQIRPTYEITFSDGQVIECGPEHLWKVTSAASRLAHSSKAVDVRIERNRSFTERGSVLRELASSIPLNTVAPLSDIAKLAGVTEVTLQRFIPKSISAIAEIPVGKKAAQYSMDDFVHWANNVIASRGELVVDGKSFSTHDLQELKLNGQWLSIRCLTQALLGENETRAQRDLVKQVLGRNAKAERRIGVETRRMRVYPVDEVILMVAEGIEYRSDRSDSGQEVMPLETVITAREMADRITDTGHNDRHNWAIAFANAIDGPNLDLPLDPYVLGAWLGDGSSRSAMVVSADPQIIDEIENAGHKIRSTFATGGPAIVYSFEGLTRALRAAGFNPTTKEPTKSIKHIPAIYRRASIPQRLALLQGLMDTDGTIDKNGSCELTLCNEQLVNDALELIRSLGIKASMNMSDACITENDPDHPGEKCRRVTGPRWRIHFTTTERVFRLARKAERLPDVSRKTQDWLYVTDITVKDPQPMRCLVVDHPEHLYLTGQFVPTHNSMSIISMVLQLATANDPRDLQFRIADPKTALVPFQNLAHVTHFVMNQTGRDRYGDFLALLEGTMRDMDRRYERLNEIEMEDLKQARASGQMMDVPFVVIVVEEASLMLMCPDKKLERAIIDQISTIANLGRGAGIYLVLATQYPSNKSIPNHLREQFSRIGFKVQDHVASNVIINESGLEDIMISGQGKMRSDGDFVQFRGFFLSPGDGPANLDLEGEETLMPNQRRGGRPSDRSLVLSHLPKSEKGKVANASGPSQKVVLSPIPAGIWDDELA